METTKCVVVDDEELARTLLSTYIEKLDFLELVGTAENPLAAINLMKRQAVDLVFLDIQMPELKGTDFAKTIGSDTRIIFTTAYSEYALQGYELNALDYLLKPITFERFLKAVHKLGKPSAERIDGSLTIKSGYDLHKVGYSEIVYIESDSEYVTYYLDQRKIMSNQRLKVLEKELPEDRFMRVHRSYIVNRDKVTGLKGRDLILGTVKVPVSDSYYEQVKKQLF